MKHIANNQNTGRVTVVVPCFKEHDNLTALSQRVSTIAHRFQSFELCLVDDNSQDGTVELVANLKKQYPWLKLIVRKAKPSLSLSVLEGFDRAENDILVCMDADLSHPPEKIPELVAALTNNDLVLGSRFVESASIDKNWHPLRFLNAFIAKIFGKLLVSVNDPMSGFFALRKNDYERVREKLNPLGYKIGLELMVKLNTRRIAEVPIDFEDRHAGHSKYSWKEMCRFARHFLRLCLYKFKARR